MEKASFGTFFSSVKQHSENWVEAKTSLWKLKGIRLVSKLAGSLTWLIVSLFLFLLFSVFIGLTLGFWLSNYTGSNVMGFGIVTLLIMLMILLLAAFRKKLFINPMIRKMIKKAYSDLKEEEEPQNN